MGYITCEVCVGTVFLYFWVSHVLSFQLYNVDMVSCGDGSQGLCVGVERDGVRGAV